MKGSVKFSPLYFPRQTTMVVYMCSSLLQLAPGSRKLSQAEKENNLETSIFTENDKFVHPGQICEFAQLYKTVILFSA